MEWAGLCRAAAEQRDGGSSSYFVDVEDPEAPPSSPAAVRCRHAGLPDQSIQIHKNIPVAVAATAAAAHPTDKREELKDRSSPLLLPPPPQSNTAPPLHKHQTQQQHQQQQQQPLALKQQQQWQQKHHTLLSPADFPFSDSVSSPVSWLSQQQQQQQQQPQRQQQQQPQQHSLPADPSFRNRCPTSAGGLAAATDITPFDALDEYCRGPQRVKTQCGESEVYAQTPGSVGAAAGAAASAVAAAAATPTAAVPTAAAPAAAAAAAVTAADYGAVSAGRASSSLRCLSTFAYSAQTENAAAIQTKTCENRETSGAAACSISLGASAAATAATAAATAIESSSQSDWQWQGAEATNEALEWPPGVCTAQSTLSPCDAANCVFTFKQTKSSSQAVPVHEGKTATAAAATATQTTTPATATAPATAARAATAAATTTAAPLRSLEEKGDTGQPFKLNLSGLHAAKEPSGSCPYTADKQLYSASSSDSTSLPSSDCSSYSSYSSNSSSSGSSSSQAAGWSSRPSTPHPSPANDAVAALSLLVSPDLKCSSTEDAGKWNKPEAAHSDSHALLQQKLQQQLRQTPPLELPQAAQAGKGVLQKKYTESEYSLQQANKPCRPFRRRATKASSSSSSSSSSSRSSSSSSSSSSDTSDPEKGRLLVAVHSPKRRFKTAGTPMARRRHFNQKYSSSSSSSSSNSKHFTVHFADGDLDSGLLRLSRATGLNGDVGVSVQCSDSAASYSSRAQSDDRQFFASSQQKQQQQRVQGSADSRREGRLQQQLRMQLRASSTAAQAEVEESSSRKERLKGPMRQRLLRQYTEHLNKLHAAKEEARRAEETPEALQPRLVRVVMEGSKLKALQSSK
ncbi:hypothetical protein, conserved [Eimeria acervulina]|uniref:Uncharacterized protein n=1 Tax=Eimeria acervulina TaxID=5801 RepID=U6GE41_EIMAC|nr:hypothetical protein, conserved [Eimeria acervulina]CDI77812.1 hypothetical protein, conserved [Eimeria acervulina]